MFLVNGLEPTKKDLLKLFEGRELLAGRTPFTTAISIDGKVPFWDHHLERLKSSFNFLFKDQDIKELEQKLNLCLKKINKTPGTQYLRFTMIENKNTVQLIFQMRELEKNNLTELSLKSIFHPGRVSSLPRNLKYGNYLEAIEEVKKAKEEGFDDCLLLDDEGRACESTIANIFFRKGNRIFTPSLKSPVLDGVTRKVILEILDELGVECEKLTPNRAEWENMDEVFLTNSTRGPVNVSKIDTREFESGSDIFRKIRTAYDVRLNSK